jgi:hypothetical protein
MQAETLVKDLPDGETLVRLMRQAAAELGREFPGLLACRLCAEPSTSDPSCEVHMALLFPQRQLILNRSGTIAKAVLREALAAARALARAHQEHRHPGIAHDVLGIAA